LRYVDGDLAPTSPVSEDEDEDNDQDNEGENEGEGEEGEDDDEGAADNANENENENENDRFSSSSTQKSFSRHPSTPPSSRIRRRSPPPLQSGADTCSSYDIVPVLAAPHATSVNAIAATTDMRWVFTGGSDGYIRKFDHFAGMNGKVPLTVAQKHPFVDSVTKVFSVLHLFLTSGWRTIILLGE
jgi:transcriptional activator SPT8